jgi:hypothetical protein
MPSGNLSERYVKKAAVNWLLDYYKQQPNVQVVISETEVRIKSNTKFGSGRADGLIVAKLLDGTIHTASVEAKSSKTLFNLSAFYEDDKWLLHAILVGVIGLILAGIIGWFIGGWFWVWAFPLLVFILTGFAYLLVTADFSHYRPVDVIAQVRRYPANEQWIALSTDVYNQLGTEGQRILHKDCQKKGIGLMRISSGGKVISLEIPKPQNLPKGYKDFLTCYARAEIIQKRLQEKVERPYDNQRGIP